VQSTVIYYTKRQRGEIYVSAIIRRSVFVVGNTYDNGRHHVERRRVRHDVPAAEGKDYPRGDHPQSSGCL